KKYAAKVVKLYPQVNRQKGTLKVEVRIAAPDASLLPDMSVRVTFYAAVTSEAAKGQPAVLAPRAAIRHGGDGAYVWAVVDDRLGRKTVEAGRDVGEETPVGRGPGGGEALVVGPEKGFRDGEGVRAERAAP